MTLGFILLSGIHPDRQMHEILCAGIDSAGAHLIRARIGNINHVQIQAHLVSFSRSRKNTKRKYPSTHIDDKEQERFRKKSIFPKNSVEIPMPLSGEKTILKTFFGTVRYFHANIQKQDPVR